MVSPSDLHDYSTPLGKFHMFLNRLSWKWIIPSMFLIALGLTAIILSPNDENDADPGPQSPVNIAAESTILPVLITTTLSESIPSAVPIKSNEGKKGKTSTNANVDFVVDGNENAMTAFDGFGDINKLTLASVKISNSVIDAPKLSQDLQGAYNVRSIILDKVWVNGNFSRVFLPKLQQFTYREVKKPAGSTDSYKEREKLKSILFFDKSSNHTWDLDKDLLNLWVNITVTIGGTKLIEVNRQDGEINLNVHFCEDILKNLKGPVSTLSLSWCNSSSASIPPNLKYVNLNNAVPSTTADLARTLKSFTQLKEFNAYLKYFCDWPGYKLEFNISDLPPSIETLAVSKVAFSSPLGFKSPVIKLVVEEFLEPSIVENFEETFANVKKIAAFNLSSSIAYPLLGKIVKAHQAEWILFELFERESPVNVSLAIEQEVQQFLKSANVSDSETNFLLELQADGNSYAGRSLTLYEKHFFRFSLFGFNKIDNFEDYMTWDSYDKIA